MTEEQEQAIRKALITISAAHHIKPTYALLEAWKTAIENLTPREIEETTKYCLQTRKSTYLPTPAEFIEIAQTIKSDIARKKRVNEEIEANSGYLPHDQEAKEKIAGMASKIGLMGKKNDPNEEQPRYFETYEYCDQFGNVKYFICYKHVDIEKFRQSCMYNHYIKPSVVHHVFFKDVKEKIKNFKGDVVGVKNTFVKLNDQQGYPVTIGYP